MSALGTSFTECHNPEVLLQWNLYNETREVLLKAHKFHHLPGTVSRNHLSRGCHQMETLSVLLAICAGNSPVTGEFPAQRPVTRSFDVFFDLHLNKRLNKQSQVWLFESPSWPLWLHCNVFSLLWETTCLGRPQNVVVALYRFHCIVSFIIRAGWPAMFVSRSCRQWQWSSSVEQWTRQTQTGKASSRMSPNSLAAETCLWWDCLGTYGSGHGGVTVLLPGFAISWLQNQVTRQPHLCDMTHMSTTEPCFNSLWPSDTIIWWHRSGSTLAQVMSSCLAAPSHYLNQC